MCRLDLSTFVPPPHLLLIATTDTGETARRQAQQTTVEFPAFRSDPDERQPATCAVGQCAAGVTLERGRDML